MLGAREFLLNIVVFCIFFDIAGSSSFYIDD